MINIQNNYEGSNPGATTVVGYQRYENCSFNPLDKIIELHNEKITLYERMVKEKDDMMARLEKLLDR